MSKGAATAPAPVDPTARVPRSIDETITDAFDDACLNVGIKDPRDVLMLWNAALSSLVLTPDVALLLKGGRETLAAQFDDGLRANPAGELVYAKGQNDDIDAIIALQVATRFPQPMKQVRTEVLTRAGVAIWYSEADAAWYDQDNTRAASAAAACAQFAAPDEADVIYPDVLGLKDEPVVRVPESDPRIAI